MSGRHTAASAGGLFNPGSRGIKALAAFAVAVALVAAVLAWRGRPQVQALPPPSHPSPVMPSLTSTPELVVVAVTGRVRRPGLVRLSNGARVADAIEAAGGVLPGTDLTAVNLARKVNDGELIAVGVTVPPEAPLAGGTGADAPRTGVGLINLNTATIEQLQTLPGMGPVLAQRVIAYREQHGGFRSVSELRQVSGIGEARFNELKDRVTV